MTSRAISNNSAECEKHPAVVVCADVNLILRQLISLLTMGMYGCRAGPLMRAVGFEER